MIPTVALWVVLGSVILLLGYSVLVNLNEDQDDSINKAVVRACKNNPFLVFTAGFVCGHLFFG